MPDPAKLHLIAGLGNPGREYERTRHNAGFLLVERLAESWSANWNAEKKFKAEVAKANDRRTLLAKPQTFMNLSGEAVGALQKFYRVSPANVLVVVDDADLPLGKIRLRPDGSLGGHHGLESVEKHLGTRAWPRLRLGIGRRDASQREISGHVLGKFGPDEWTEFEQVLKHAAAAAECWLQDGALEAMNRFNGPIPGQQKDK